MLASRNRPEENLTRAPLTKGRPGSRVTFFPSRKNGGAVACGNLQQANYCVHLEYRPDVLSYHCRPPTVCGGARRYKADFLVTLSSGPPIYLKFLPSDDQPEALVRDQKQAVEAMLRDKGLLFHWLEASDLPHPQVSYNLRALYHQGFGSSQRAAEQVRAQVMAMPEQRATFGALFAGGATSADICHAIFLDQLWTNLKEQLTLQTMIYGGRDGHL
ncbi:hypothetical protein BSF44_44790 [Pseudomonas sp. ACN8]|jgi:hypothetical protein|uniref:hypothetical protein n=1 Tax=Pseudomonas sp. ACN8 TaxID=1920428 RepID=UPI000BB31652|nr:hypothetical protein [Pseudomonas sp. ACN8]PBJ19646.1 hypothetical protein BSF44_44790 [Pseudomonas sp. ACN8]